MLETLVPLSSNDCLKVLKYPQTEYCNLFSVSVRNSFPNFELLLTVNDLTLTSKTAFKPVDFT